MRQTRNPPPAQKGYEYLTMADDAPRRLRVAIAGGGICGALLATQLRRSNLWDVRCYEKTPRTGGPPGVNLLLNHNGIAALKHHDEDLCQRLEAVGFEMRTWAAHSMTGKVHYSEDVVASGLADCAGLRARWDHFVAAIRAAAEEDEGGLGICYDAAVDSYRYDGDKVVVSVLNGDGQIDESEVDLLIACDGRFSAIRAQVEGGTLPDPDVGDVANFKFLIPDTTDGLIDDYVRVYNIPDADALRGRFPHLADDDAFVKECMSGLARVGIMRMKDPSGDKVGIYGNVRIPRGGKLPESARTADAMRALFTPKEGTGA
jgi:2-polyprenyl-6-methoxyphenol hydroxylase-like FAD-dependent oxidoreductase